MVVVVVVVPAVVGQPTSQPTLVGCAMNTTWRRSPVFSGNMLHVWPSKHSLVRLVFGPSRCV